MNFNLLNLQIAELSIENKIGNLNLSEETKEWVKENLAPIEAELMRVPSQEEGEELAKVVTDKCENFQTLLTTLDFSSPFSLQEQKEFVGSFHAIQETIYDLKGHYNQPLAKQKFLAVIRDLRDHVCSNMRDSCCVKANTNDECSGYFSLLAMKWDAARDNDDFILVVEDRVGDFDPLDFSDDGADLVKQLKKLTKEL